MKPKSLLPILVMISLLSATSCRYIEDEYHHYYLQLDNESNINLLAELYIECDSSLYGHRVYYIISNYHDSIYASNKKRDSDILEIKAGSSISASSDNIINYSYDYYDGLSILENLLETNFIQIYIYDQVLYNNQKPDSLLAVYRLYRRDLIQLDWSISYPPTEEMIKNMDILLPTEN
ncbi:MAG: hypothetical protein K6E86_09305 [Bacteroidales bacterium]|nr:hypothetical protein [Bacteroidales bacterium]